MPGQVRMHPLRNPQTHTKLNKVAINIPMTQSIPVSGAEDEDTLDGIFSPYGHIPEECLAQLRRKRNFTVFVPLALDGKKQIVEVTVWGSQIKDLANSTAR